MVGELAMVGRLAMVGEVAIIGELHIARVGTIAVSKLGVLQTCPCMLLWSLFRCPQFEKRFGCLMQEWRIGYQAVK